jgi:hypothetical protein
MLERQLGVISLSLSRRRSTAVEMVRPFLLFEEEVAKKLTWLENYDKAIARVVSGLAIHDPEIIRPIVE